MKLTQLVGTFRDRLSDPADDHNAFAARLGSGANNTGGYQGIGAKYIQVFSGPSIYEERIAIWAPGSAVDPRIYDSSLSMVSEEFCAVDASGTGTFARVGWSAYFDEADWDTFTGIGFETTSDGFWQTSLVTSPDLLSTENRQIRHVKSAAVSTDWHLLRVEVNARLRTIYWFIDDAIVDWVTLADPLEGWALAKPLFLRHEIKNDSGDSRLYYGAAGSPFLAIGEPEAADLVTGSVRQPTISATGVTDRFVRLLGSDYVTDGDAGTHQFSQWQIDTSTNFDDPLTFDSDWDPRQLTLQDYNFLLPATTYYARVRYRSSKCYESPWSTPVEFTTLSAPSPDDPTQNPSTPWGPVEEPCEPNDPPPTTVWTKSGPC